MWPTWREPEPRAGDQAVEAFLGRILHRRMRPQDEDGQNLQGAPNSLLATERARGRRIRRHRVPGDRLLRDARVVVVVCTIGFELVVTVLSNIGVAHASVTFFGDGIGYLSAIPVVFVAYCSASWVLAGRTPGMFLLGVRVVRPDGESPRAGRSVARSSPTGFRPSSCSGSYGSCSTIGARASTTRSPVRLSSTTGRAGEARSRFSKRRCSHRSRWLVRI